MSTSGDEVAQLCAGAGFNLYPWQQYALRVILGERADGRWNAREAAFLVSRQSGKGGVLHAIDLAGLFLFDDVREILHTAHEFKTAKKAYREIKEIIKAAPHLHAQVERRGARVVGFRNSNEDTSITLQNGCVLRFMARSHNTGRGFSPQMVIMDEAQECSEGTRQALRYTTRAQPNPLFVWCGTVPTEQNNGEVFKSLRDRGRQGGDRSLAWMEWSPPPGCDPHSDEAVEWATPGMPYQITFETVLDEREAAVSEEQWAGFVREALSWWPDEGDNKAKWLVIPEAEWVACKSGEKVESDGWLEGPVTLAVEVTFDRSAATISAAGDCREGGVGVEVIESGAGTHWVVDSLVALTSDESKPVGRVVVDPGGPAASLIEPLEAAGVTVTQCKFADCKVATAGMRDAAKAQGIVHRDRPELNDAVAHAQPRTVSDAVLVDRRAGVDVSPFIAALLARWGHLQGYEAPVEPGYLSPRR